MDYDISGIEFKEAKDIIGPISDLPCVIAIILFGSVARGEKTPISDIDICVITNSGINDDIKDTIMSYSSRVIDIRLFSDLPPVIQYQVIKEGKFLFSRDDFSLNTIIISSIREWLDFQSTYARACYAAIRGPG